MNTLRSIGLACASAALMSGAQASVLLASSISADTVLDWGSLGPEFTAVAPGTSLGLVTVTGSSSYTVLSGSTFNADFAATDNVLAMFDINTGDVTSGGFDLLFASAVQGFGTQIQANQFGAFGGLMEVFAGVNLLASFNLAGMNGGNGDGSALFAGVMSDALDITRIRFTGFGDGAGISSLQFDTQFTANPVPAPASLLLAGAALLGLVGARRRAA
jgi:hypothetical protein